MTLEQCKRLKEMGFPQNGEVARFFRDTEDYEEDYYDNPTAEEALAWVGEKLKERIDISFYPNRVRIKCIIYNRGMWQSAHNTLSDAVYALIVWAHENKLLEA
jgi:hypothetical protein